MPFADVVIDFPSPFPIKVIGEDVPGFQEMVVAIFERHAPGLTPSDVKQRPSQSGRYIAITVTFTATSKEQINNIYSELTTEPQVLWAL